MENKINQLSLRSPSRVPYRTELLPRVCVECLIGKQKKPVSRCHLDISIHCVPSRHLSTLRRRSSGTFHRMHSIGRPGSNSQRDVILEIYCQRSTRHNHSCKVRTFALNTRPVSPRPFEVSTASCCCLRPFQPSQQNASPAGQQPHYSGVE